MSIQLDLFPSINGGEAVSNLDSPCIDCGLATTPHNSRGRPAGCWELYMVHDHVWKRAGMAPNGGCLCIGCLEARLGRKLCYRDFTSASCNRPSSVDTVRLGRRKMADQIKSRRPRAGGGGLQTIRSGAAQTAATAPNGQGKGPSVFFNSEDQ